jgi:putative acetyltransferase
MAMDPIDIRTIKASDNGVLATIIRSALAEFKANKPGTVYYDDTTDHLYELFERPGAEYFVAEFDGAVAGGAGIFPTAGLEPDTCELVKLYLSANARGRGVGKILVQRCLEAAKLCGYKKVYLETMPELIIAVPMYERLGFTYLQGPLGNSGHNGCNIWMLKDL